MILMWLGWRGHHSRNLCDNIKKGLKTPWGRLYYCSQYVLLLPRTTYIPAPLAVGLTVWLALGSDACHFSTEVLTASTLFALCFLLFATTNPKCWQRLFPYFWAPNWSQDMAKTQLAEDVYCEQEINFIIWHYWKKNGRGCLLQSLFWLIHFLATCHCLMEISLRINLKTFGPDIKASPCSHSS